MKKIFKRLFNNKHIQTFNTETTFLPQEFILGDSNKAAQESCEIIKAQQKIMLTP